MAREPTFARRSWGLVPAGIVSRSQPSRNLRGGDLRSDADRPRQRGPLRHSFHRAESRLPRPGLQPGAERGPRRHPRHGRAAGAAARGWPGSRPGDEDASVRGAIRFTGQVARDPRGQQPSIFDVRDAAGETGAATDPAALPPHLAGRVAFHRPPATVPDVPTRRAEAAEDVFREAVAEARRWGIAARRPTCPRASMRLVEGVRAVEKEGWQDPRAILSALFIGRSHSLIWLKRPCGEPRPASNR
jgi:hypothetical protein